MLLPSLELVLESDETSSVEESPELPLELPLVEPELPEEG